MKSGIIVDTNDLVRAFKETADEANIAVGIFVRNQMALLCADIIKHLGPNKFHQQGMLAQKKHTESGIETDMNRYFRQIPNDAVTWMDQRSGKRMIRTPSNYNRVFAVSEDRFKWPTDIWAMQAMHKSVRNQESPSPYYVHGRNLVKDYAKMVKAHVGRTKSAWVTAFDYFNKKEGLAKYAVPSWVSRHKDHSSKFSSSSFTQSGSYAWGQASSTLALGDDPQGMIDQAIRTRESDLMRGMMKGGAGWRLNAIMKKHSAPAFQRAA